MLPARILLKVGGKVRARIFLLLASCRGKGSLGVGVPQADFIFTKIPRKFQGVPKRNKKRVVTWDPAVVGRFFGVEPDEPIPFPLGDGR